VVGARAQRLQWAIGGVVVAVLACAGLAAAEPRITSVVPAAVSADVTVRITGEGFAATASGNEVLFTPVSGAPAATGVVTAVSALDPTGTLRRITVLVPRGLPLGRAAISVRNTSTGQVASGGSVEIVALEATPVTLAPGQTRDVLVVLRGAWSFDAASTRVTLGSGITVNRVTVAEPARLVATVTVSATAAVGARTLGIVTPSMTAALVEGLRVDAASAGNAAPLFTTTPPTTATAGVPLLYEAAAIDPDGDAVTFVLGSGPDGMAVEATTGRLAWTPTPAQGGPQAVTLLARDGRGGEAAQAFTVTVTVPITLESLTVDPASVRFTERGATRQLAVTGRFSDQTTRDLTAASTGTTYETSDAAVVGVSPDGLLTAVGAGAATVTARHAGRSATVEVTVSLVSLTGLDVSPSPATLRAVGATLPLLVMAGYSDGTTRDVTSDPATTYETSDAAVVGVSPDGLLTAAGAGVATVTVRHAGLSRAVEVTVSLVSLTGLDILPSRTTLRAIGATLPLVVMAGYSDGTTRDVTSDPATVYEAGDAAVVTVAAGVVTAVGAGRTPVVAAFGGRSAVADIDVVLASTSGAGFVRGEVFDDRTGLPLGGATVALLADRAGPLAVPVEVTADARGRFVLPARAGTVAVRVSMAGFTSVDRLAVVGADGAATLLDARLTLLEAPRVVVSPAQGGVAANARGDVSLAVPAGALDAAAAVALTTVSNQGLAGRLPLGWSPVFAVEVTPALVLSVPAVLTVPRLDSLLAPGSPVVLARYDETARAWRAVAPAAVSADSISGSVEAGGQFAFLVADPPPFEPPAPAAGELLAGVAAPSLPASLTASGVVVPRAAPPGDEARAVGTVIADAGEPMPSGVVVRARVAEQFDLLDRSTVAPQPYTQDLVLYARPRVPQGGRLATTFPIAPSLRFTIQQLALGTVRLDVSADEPVEGGAVVGAAGGTVGDPLGALLDVPDGALAGDTFIGIAPIAASQPPIVLPAGLTPLGGATVDLVGVTFSRAATLSVPRPAGLAADAIVVLAEVFVDPFGGRRLRLVGRGLAGTTRITAQTNVGGLALDGVSRGGDFLFVQLAEPIGVVDGTLRGPGGTAPFGGALITSDTSPFADLSSSTGRFVVAARVGALTTVRALDTVGGDGAAGEVAAATAFGVTPLALTLTLVPPSVVETVPSAGAVNVPLDSTIVITFSEPIDPGSVTSESIVVRAGTTEVAGTRVLSADRRRVTFRPDGPLASLTTHLVVVSTGIRDAGGNPMTDSVSVEFRTVDPSKPPPPDPGRITAELPDEDGFVLVVGTGGTAEAGRPVTVTNPRTQETTTVLALEDGSFRVRIGARVGDELALTLREAGGREVTFLISQFTGPGGSTAIGAAGGVVTGPGGRLARLAPRALVEPGIFAFVAADPSDLPGVPAPFTLVDRFALTMEGARFNTLRSLTLGESQNRFMPVQAVDEPFEATGRFVVPTDFLVGAKVRFTAVAVDAGGARTTVEAATLVVGTGPDAARVLAINDVRFPAVTLDVPRQATPDLEVTATAVAPAARVDLELPAPAQPSEAILLVRPVLVGAEQRLVAVDELVVVPAHGGALLRTRGPLLPGLTRPGVVAVISSAEPLALLVGRIAGPPAIVTADGWPLVAETTTANGRFALPVRAGAALTLRAVNRATLEEIASFQVTAPAAGASADIGTPLGSVGSTLTVTATPDTRSLVDIGAPVVFTFSEPVDPASLASSVLVTDAAGRRVFGRLERNDTGEVVTFTPDRRWKFGSRYRYGVGLGVKALSGATLAAPFSGEFTTFAPRVLSTLDLGEARDVAAANGIAWVATSSGVSVVDVNRPTAPVERAAIPLPGGAASVALVTTPFTDRVGQARSGTFGVVVFGDPVGGGFLEIYDLQAPAAPQRVGRVQVSAAAGVTPRGFSPLPPGTPRHVSVEGTRALVTVAGAGVQAVELSQAVPLALDDPGLGLGPALTAAAATPEAVVALNGRVSSAGPSGLQQHDAASLAPVAGAAGDGMSRLVLLPAAAVSPSLADGPGGVDEGVVLAVATGAPGVPLQVFLAAAEATPVLIGAVRLPADGLGLAADVDERLAYVSVGGRGVALLDLAAPGGTTPPDLDRDGADDRLLGLVDTPGTSRAVALDLARGLAWIADGDAGLTGVQILPPRVRALTLLRDPVRAIAGEERQARVLYASDEALLVRLSVVAPPDAGLLLVLQDGAASPDLQMSFEGVRVVPVPPGSSEFVAALPFGSLSRTAVGSLEVRTAAGLVVASARFEVRAHPAALPPVRRLLGGPQPLRLAAPGASARVGVAAFVEGDEVFNVSRPETGTGYDVEPLGPIRVSTDGEVTGIGGGFGVVLVANGPATTTIGVDVGGDPAPVALEVAERDVVLRTRAPAPLPVRARLSDGSAVPIGEFPAATFATDVPGVVEVAAGGAVTAVADGAVVVTALLGELSATVRLFVELRRPASVEGIAITTPSPAANRGGVQLTAAIVATGSLDGLPVAFSVTGASTGSGTAETDLQGRAALLIEVPAAGGVLDVTARIVDPATSQERVATRRVEVQPASGDTEADPTGRVPGLLPRLGVVTGSVGGGDGRDTFLLEGPPGSATISLDLPADVDPATVRITLRGENDEVLAVLPISAGRNEVSVPLAGGNARISIERTGAAITYRLRAKLSPDPIEITAVTPSSGAPGTPVSITGRGFGTRVADVTVLFGGVAARTLAVTPTGITTSVPANAVDGPLEVIVADQRASGPNFVTGNPGPLGTGFLQPALYSSFRKDPTSGVVVDIGRIIVGFDPGATAAAVREVAARVGAEVVGFYPRTNEYVFGYPRHRSLDDLTAALTRLRAEPLVEAAEPNHAPQTTGYSIDVRDRGGVWGNGAAKSETLALIRLFEAVEVARDTPPFHERAQLREVRVAVLDTGFSPKKQDEFGDPMFVQTLNVDPNTGQYAPVPTTVLETGTHGTAVTSIIGARNDGTPLSGVLGSLLKPGESPFPMLTYVIGRTLEEVNQARAKWIEAGKDPRFFSQDVGQLSDDKIKAAFEDVIARGDVDVMNLSFGSDGWDSATTGYGPDNAFYYDKQIKLMTTRTLVVAAAGNEGVDAAHHAPSLLATIRGHVVSVGAVAVVDVDKSGERRDRRAFFYKNNPSRSRGPSCKPPKKLAGSNCGSTVMLAAPGEDVFASNVPGGTDYTYFNGTSSATPIVSGVAAIVQALRPTPAPIPAPELRSILVDTADDISATWDPGPMRRVNALAAVLRVLRPVSTHRVWVADSEDAPGAATRGAIVGLDVDPMSGEPAAMPPLELAGTVTLGSETGFVFNTVTAQRPRSLVTSPTGMLFAVARDATLGDGVLIASTRTGEATGFVPLSGAHPVDGGGGAPVTLATPRPGLAVSRDGRLLFVAADTQLFLVDATGASPRLLSRFEDLPAPLNLGLALAVPPVSLAERLAAIRTAVVSGGGYGTPATTGPLAVSADGRTLYLACRTGTGTGQQRGFVIALDIDTTRDLDPATPDLEPDLSAFLSIRHVFRPDDGQPTRSLDGDEPSDIAVDPTGRHLYLTHGGADGFIAVSGVDEDLLRLRSLALIGFLGALQVGGLGGLLGLATTMTVANVTLAATLNDLALLEKAKTQTGQTILSAPGVTAVFDATPGAGPPEQQWYFTSSVNFGWNPATSGTRLIDQFTFGQVYAARPSGIAIHPRGQRALMAFSQTGNFGVLDLTSQAAFGNTAAPGAPATAFRGVVGVTPALRLDNHLWPRRGAFDVPIAGGSRQVESPDTALLFPGPIVYAQNGRFAAAVHTGAGVPGEVTVTMPDFSVDNTLRLRLTELGFDIAPGAASGTNARGETITVGQPFTFVRGGGALSIIDNRAIDTNLSVFAALPVPDGLGGTRPYHTVRPVCRVPSPDVPACTEDVVRHVFAVEFADSRRRDLARPRGVAIDPFVWIEAPRWGDHLQSGTAIVVAWRDFRAARLRIRVLDLGLGDTPPAEPAVVVSLDRPLTLVERGFRNVRQDFLDLFGFDFPEDGRRFRIEATIVLENADELATATVDVRYRQ
jgi:hypothetical protein